jgi:FlaG/FlaF family flagellin (archaellin)
MHAVSSRQDLASSLQVQRYGLLAQTLTTKFTLEAGKMKRILTGIAILGLASFAANLSAQEQTATPQTQTSTAPQTAQPPVDAQSQQATQSFEGKISKSGDKLVLKDASTQTAYQLDDQDKAKQFEGQSVKVSGTMDSSTNTLHIVDITPSGSR